MARRGEKLVHHFGFTTNLKKKKKTLPIRVLTSSTLKIFTNKFNM
jgi:hypothetical protein